MINVPPIEFCSKITVNQEILRNDLFGEFGKPIKNAKFNRAKILSRLMKTIIHSRMKTEKKENLDRLIVFTFVKHSLSS